MKKIISVLLLSLMLICPLTISAEDNGLYRDVVGEISGRKNDDVTIYLFRGDGCPHCENASAWIAHMIKEYPDISFSDYEVWNNEDNLNLMFGVRELLGAEIDEGVPMIVIGDKYWLGFNPNGTLEMENVVREYLGLDAISTATYSSNEKTPVQENIPADTVQENIVDVGNKDLTNTSKGVGFIEVCGGLALISVAVLAICLSYKVLTTGEKKNECKCQVAIEETEKKEPEVPAKKTTKKKKTKKATTKKTK